MYLISLLDIVKDTTESQWVTNKSTSWIAWVWPHVVNIGIQDEKHRRQKCPGCIFILEFSLLFNFVLIPTRKSTAFLNLPSGLTWGFIKKNCHLSYFLDKTLDSYYRNAYAENAGGQKERASFAQKIHTPAINFQWYSLYTHFQSSNLPTL